MYFKDGEISMTVVGDKLKIARKNSKLTQGKLAEGLVNRSYISQIEKGLVIPSYKVLESLAKRLNKDIHYFLEEEEVNLIIANEIHKTIRSAQLFIELKEFNKAESLIIELDITKLDSGEKGLYYWIAGEIHSHKEEWDKSIESFLESVSLVEEIDNEILLSRVLNSFSKVYINLSDFDKALEKLIEAGNLLIKNYIYDTLKVEILINMAICHGRIGEYRSAIRLCKEAEYINKMTNNHYKSGEIYMTMGICYKKLKDLDNAKLYYDKANKFFDIFELNFNKAGILINLGILYRETKEFSTSLNYLNAAQEAFYNLNEEFESYNCSIELAKTFLHSKKSNIAKKILLKNIDIIPPQYKTLKYQNLELLSEVYVSESNFQKALDCLKKASLLNLTKLENDLNIRLAKIHTRLGNYQTAAELFEKSC